MKLLWLTDTHFDHCEGTPQLLGKYLAAEFPSVTGAVISGDISRAGRFAEDIANFSNGLGAPVWFVLGNHDGWGKAWAEVKADAKGVPGYLSTGKLVKFSDGIVLTGVNGWYDGYYGDAERSCVGLVDWDRMPDFQSLLHVRTALISQFRRLSFIEADQAKKNLRKACKLGTTKTVYFATHVPPWLEASHHGRKEDPMWSPWFTSKLLGDAIFEVSQEYPQVQFNILCGHSHFGGWCKIADNVICYTGQATYGSPNVCGVLSEHTVKMFSQPF